MTKGTKKIKLDSSIIPHMVETTASTASRRNVAGTIERTDRFKNIDDGLIPFRNGGTAYGSGKSTVDVRDAVVLCQKCYYNFSIFRNIIDLMTEFSANNIFYRGGSKKSRDFFEALFNKINLWDLQDKFFREYYRSGNVFIYRFDANVKQDDIKRITQVFGDEQSETLNNLIIPSRYIILNPADIQMVGTANFGWAIYHKILTEFEIIQLKNQKTEEDTEIFNSLPPQVQKDILSGKKAISLPLESSKIAIVFYKKQDYEPFAVPMGYPVLEDINAKYEMKKIDMAIARTMQQIILLVTNGAEPDKGGINQKNLDALRELFKNPTVGRTLVADYTTEAEWKIPEIGNLLDPQKYAILDRDINIGLNNVFAGEEKFANQQQKVDLFIARLEQARKAFLNNFLIPEIKRISKDVGFKNFPTPYFEDIELKDTQNYAKLYTRLIELGVLTAEQGLKAIETNTLPDPSVIIEEQKSYKEQRDNGLYEPLIGKPKDEAGRPDGSGGVPQISKKISPMGKSKASIDDQKYSLSKIKENLSLAQELEKDVVSVLKQKHNIKKMTKLQKEVSEQITNTIIVNEEPSKWKESIALYCESPLDKNKKRVKEITEIACYHQVNFYLAGILLASKVNEQAI